MILIENTVISDDIADKFFVCNLDKCKGACCVEGDLGAPLEAEELHILQRIYPKVKPYLSPEGIAAIEKQGLYEPDGEGGFVTTTVGGRECVFATWNDKGILKCGIEDAYNDGQVDWKKPISCHLYPIRVTKYDQYHALNYDRWPICSPACGLGKELNVPVYKFVREALVRAYGEAWYAELVAEIEGTANNEQ
ncbi:DUF3109 family protein [Rudanella paleaurantiibacter]|uniref:DUF3109 family protein n=1 Tax=Rudanella paleaurantiibacter TaxID=2614655 RepID=A0A7J5TS63_9BACT|nr:DUF3109 family protein [Rudanella paleaurantiibacter]KAB7725600.1 DUF3109 family protein [Rudanella paleaurantiibacter]